MSAPTIPSASDGHAVEPTPLYTRHTRGAIEADRDRRRRTQRAGFLAWGAPNRPPLIDSPRRAEP